MTNQINYFDFYIVYFKIINANHALIFYSSSSWLKTPKCTNIICSKYLFSYYISHRNTHPSYKFYYSSIRLKPH